MIIFSHTNHYDGLEGDASVRLVLSQTVPPQKNGPIYKMLERLGLDFELPASLRLHPSFRYQLATDEDFGSYAAMVLPFQNGEGEFVGVEMCFLTDDGNFAPVVEPRLQYWLNESVTGAFHAIDPPQGMYGVAVGYANALAAHFFTGIPMCAVNTARDLAALDIPRVVRTLNIFADSASAAEAQLLKTKCEEILGVQAVVLEPPTPHATWLHEFTFRGAIPVDDIAAGLSKLSSTHDQADGDVNG